MRLTLERAPCTAQTLYPTGMLVVLGLINRLSHQLDFVIYLCPWMRTDPVLVLGNDDVSCLQMLASSRLAPMNEPTETTNKTDAR